MTHRWLAFCSLCLFFVTMAAGFAAEQPEPAWKYSAAGLAPFWQGDTVTGESVLFIKDAGTGAAKAAVLFPIQEIRDVRNSRGDVIYEQGRDYQFTAGSRELVLPAGSRIPARTTLELRKPAKSQPYELTHRDGNGEILFGAALEYADMQTCITYVTGEKEWDSPLPKFDPQQLPRVLGRLKGQQPVSLVVLGDSISAGANASGGYQQAPYQPAYPELVRQKLATEFGVPVKLTNLSVGGMDSAWGLTQVDAVLAAQPDLVVIAFGMNDSAGRAGKDFGEKIAATIEAIRKQRAETEFILVATMLGNPDWIRLQQPLFPAYRDELLKLQGPGCTVADLTSVWTEFLKRKRDWDQTGNGVNHPNDFGHRVYAQVITALLVAAE